MLKSFLLSRPYALFDAENAEHRKVYNQYLKTKSWADCPYQFVLEEPFLDLPSCINHKLIHYYISQEFKKDRTKKRVLVKR